MTAVREVYTYPGKIFYIVTWIVEGKGAFHAIITSAREFYGKNNCRPGSRPPLAYPKGPQYSTYK
jgi:hypothetical protein